jgi:hypothetical protein
MFPQFSVSVEREEIAADFMHQIKVPDENWTYIDRKGHGHFWKDKRVPTCKYVVTGEVFVGDEYDGEMVKIRQWQCRICSETIEPGYRMEHPPPVLGPTWVTVQIDLDRNPESFVLTPEEYARSVEAWRDHLRELRR